MITHSIALRGAANLGRRAFLDAGTGNAAIEVYGTARPAAGDPAGADPLLTIVLAKPCGELDDNGALILAANEPAGELVASTGDALWARFVNGDGEWAFDADVSVDGGGGEVQFPDINLKAGGRAPLSPSSLG